MFNVMNKLERSEAGVSRRTKKILFGVGLVVYILGLYLLTFVNSMADNWAGIVAPLCIIGGLVTMFIGLVLRPFESEKRENKADVEPTT